MPTSVVPRSASDSARMSPLQFFLLAPFSKALSTSCSKTSRTLTRATFSHSTHTHGGLSRSTGKRRKAAQERYPSIGSHSASLGATRSIQAPSHIKAPHSSCPFVIALFTTSQRQVPADGNDKLEVQINKRFPPNKMMAGTGNPFWPDKCLGGGCANWAVESATKFAKEAFGRLRIEPNYQRIEWPPDAD